MKKKIIILLMGASIFGYAQEKQSSTAVMKDEGSVVIAPSGPILEPCISGSYNIETGKLASFSYNWGNAQCNECYDWDINYDANSTQNSTVGNLTIVSSDMGKTVTVVGNYNGPFALALTYFDETGCHTCTFNGEVITIPPPPNCCAPNLYPHFICMGSRHGGFIKMIDNPACPVDWSKISKVEISLTGGAQFNSGLGNPVTTTTWVGPFNGEKQQTVYGKMSDCNVNEKEFTATLKFYYNNGCSPVTKEATGIDTHIFNDNQLNDDHSRKQDSELVNQIIVSPNPTSSIIKFEGADLSKYKISIIDGNGIEIIQNRNINRDINIQDQKAGIYFYKITDENGFIQQGKIIKQ